MCQIWEITIIWLKKRSIKSLFLAKDFRKLKEINVKNNTTKHRLFQCNVSLQLS